jgi:hypothetical protein
LPQTTATSSKTHFLGPLHMLPIWSVHIQLVTLPLTMPSVCVCVCVCVSLSLSLSPARASERAF